MAASICRAQVGARHRAGRGEIRGCRRLGTWPWWLNSKLPSRGYTMALNDDECFKVVINPCMYPSIEIPLIDSDIANDKEWIEYFKSKEESIYSRGGLVAQTTFGIFGTNDELVSYSDSLNWCPPETTILFFIFLMEQPKKALNSSE